MIHTSFIDAIRLVFKMNPHFSHEKINPNTSENRSGMRASRYLSVARAPELLIPQPLSAAAAPQLLLRQSK